MHAPAEPGAGQPTVTVPTNADVAAMSGADYEAMLKEISKRLLKGSGLDRDPEIAQLVEVAWKKTLTPNES